MNARERYFWDLNGYLVVKGALTRREIDEANEIVDKHSSEIRVGGNTGGNSETFAGTGRPELPGILEFPQTGLRTVPETPGPSGPRLAPTSHVRSRLQTRPRSHVHRKRKGHGGSHHARKRRAPSPPRCLQPSEWIPLRRRRDGRLAAHRLQAGNRRFRLRARQPQVELSNPHRCPYRRRGHGRSGPTVQSRRAMSSSSWTVRRRTVRGRGSSIPGDDPFCSSMRLGRVPAAALGSRSPFPKSTGISTLSKA